MTDDEVDALLSGIEDSQGQVNYEGIYYSSLLTLCLSHMCCFILPYGCRVCQDSNGWLDETRSPAVVVL